MCLKLNAPGMQMGNGLISVDSRLDSVITDSGVLFAIPDPPRQDESCLYPSLNLREVNISLLKFCTFWLCLDVSLVAPSSRGKASGLQLLILQRSGDCASVKYPCGSL